MIVDDEPLIRKGLTKLIESNDLGWTVAGEAGNGREAIQKVAQLQPDLIISDIRMPVMDGLELAKYIWEHSPHTMVIILTGYRDFEYAQAAVRYGVKEFLLKPCPADEICRVLREAYTQFQEKAEFLEKERRALREREDHAFRAALLRLPPLAGGENLRIEELLAGHVFWLIRVDTFTPEGKEYRPEDGPLLQFAVVNIMEELLEASQHRGRWITVEYGRFAFFMETSNDHFHFFNELCATVQRLLGIALTAQSLGVVSSAMEVSSMYRRYEADESPNSDADEVLIPAPGAVDETKVTSVQAEITSFLLLGRHAELSAFLRQRFWEDPDALMPQSRADALCLALAIREVMRKEIASTQEDWDIGAEIQKLRRMVSREEVGEWVRGRIAVMEQALASWLEERNSRLAERTTRYVEQHYFEECSLVSVASYMHLNPNYFSNLFKKQTGESFTSYLTRFRIDKAKMLLTNTDMKISEIAEAVGYTDSNYFATAFKQVVGKPPTEYRKMYQLIK
ncbi:response regulator [Paenibacillus oryzisoli]|uniref:response regulator transcription factor n=1 Tax=Paenibacillus oryzisoli TaxID=1850517 RepID=UPI003D2A0E8B